jgi:hypothetical protein
MSAAASGNWIRRTDARHRGRVELVGLVGGELRSVCTCPVARATGSSCQHAVPAPRVAGRVVRDIGAIIDAARKQVSVTANAALTGLHWQIGQRVHTEVLEERRAEYGAQIVSAAGRQWEARYGRGFGTTEWKLAAPPCPDRAPRAHAPLRRRRARTRSPSGRAGAA